MARKLSKPLADGRKHYLVTWLEWGRTERRVVVALNAQDARWEAGVGGRTPNYISGVSAVRATPIEAREWEGE